MAFSWIRSQLHTPCGKGVQRLYDPHGRAGSVRITASGESFYRLGADQRADRCLVGYLSGGVALATQAQMDSSV